MATLWSGYEGHWVAYDGGSEVLDLRLGSSFSSSRYAVLFKRPFRIVANTCGDLRSIPIFPTCVQVVQMDAETLELENDWVGSLIVLEPEAQINRELQMSHSDVYFFSDIGYNAPGKRTRRKNLDVKGSEVKALADSVPMFSAPGCAPLFVHACTTNVQFKQTRQY